MNDPAFDEKYGSHRYRDDCPECKAQWKGKDIFEHFMEAKIDPNHKQHEHHKNDTVKEIYAIASNYGYSIEKPEYFRHLIGVQLAYDDPNYYDGVSFWQCPGCKVAWNRFTGERTEQFVPKGDTNETR